LTGRHFEPPLNVSERIVVAENRNMASIAPPPTPPLVSLEDDDRVRRLNLKLFKILVSSITVFVTAWFCTLGAIPAILAIMVAKHVLVAILMMGLGIHD
jgi:hypothetical protein